MRAYSEDLRQRIVRAIDRGKRPKEVAEHFEVSPASVRRFVKQQQEQGHLRAQLPPGRPRSLSKEQEAALVEQVTTHKDASLHEHCELLSKAIGRRVSIMTVQRTFVRSGITRKKARQPSERDEVARLEWWAKSRRLDPDKLVFVDESGTHLGMSRSHARSFRGERAYTVAPYHPGERTNLIAALSTSGVQAPWLVTGGSVDTTTFVTYVEQVLCSTLLPGQIVVLDNYSIHTDSKVRELIEAKGCELLFLPTYSPDFNPIENAFSKIKALLRQAQAATQDALSDAIKHACNAITLQDTLAWFRLCGYSTQYF